MELQEARLEVQRGEHAVAHIQTKDHGDAEVVHDYERMLHGMDLPSGFIFELELQATGSVHSCSMTVGHSDVVVRLLAEVRETGLMQAVEGSAQEADLGSGIDEEVSHTKSVERACDVDLLFASGLDDDAACIGRRLLVGCSGTGRRGAAAGGIRSR